MVLKGKMYRYYHYLVDAPIYWIARICGKVAGAFSADYRNIWLISEQGNEARDNGYWFYRYVREKHPEINTYFVINPESSDYKKVAALGKTVKPDTWKHYILFANAEKLISSHVLGYVPKGLYRELDRKINLIKGKKVFLQHGITKDRYEWGYAHNCHLDLWVCGAKPEYDFIKADSGFTDGVVELLGFVRFDQLWKDNETKKQLLIMPTWRKYACEGNDDKGFRETEYYKAYQELLNDSEFHELIKSKGYSIIFYPHAETQKYIHCFSTCFDDVVIAKKADYDVQKLLKESEILITDFSSVYFDFAYMEKPLFYYQFDYEHYRQTHYEKGYFEYDRDGFGPVVTEKKALIEEVRKLFETGETAEYSTRRNDFFVLRDAENAKRNFEKIKEL